MPPKPITRNTLFCGDSLPILREHIADESVDLVYLDPPGWYAHIIDYLWPDCG